MSLIPGLFLLFVCLLANVAVHADEQLQVRVYYAINSPDRPEVDWERDFDRRPIEVMEFFGIDEGMTILEVMAGSGYYTELLSAAAGNSGKVFAHNELMTMRMRHGAVEKAITKRLANNRLPNVELWIQEIDELKLEGSVDLATIILNLHDLYIFGGEEQALAALNSIMVALKPGGVLGIVDHVGAPDQDNTYLHRIDPIIIDELLFRAGFVVTGRSNVLYNPDDDHSLHVFDPEIKGRTDRLVIRAIKPNYR